MMTENLLRFSHERKTDSRGRVQRNAGQRRGLVERYKAGGMSQAEFCWRERIHPTTFNYWLRSTGRRGRSAHARWRAQRAYGFAQVQLALTGPAPIEMELRSGLCLRVRDVTWLKDLMEFIRQVQGAVGVPHAELHAGLKVYGATEAADLRKSFTGLWPLATNELMEDPRLGGLFVSCNLRRNWGKSLYWSA